MHLLLLLPLPLWHRSQPLDVSDCWPGTYDLRMYPARIAETVQIGTNATEMVFEVFSTVSQIKCLSWPKYPATIR